MKQIMFSVFDLKTQQFDRPFCAVNIATAFRMMTDALEGESLLSKHPADFGLFKIATFETDTGVVTPENPESLGLLLQFVKQPAEPPLLQAMKGGRE